MSPRTDKPRQAALCCEASWKARGLPAMAGTWKTRCRLHGGMSTGARTAEGKARVLAALVEGRQRWLEELRRAKKAGLIA